MPACVFEAFEAEDYEDLSDDNKNPLERISVVIAVIAENAIRKTAKQNVKQYVSLLRNFLKSNQWSLVERTEVLPSGTEVATISTLETDAFRAVGFIPFRVKVHLRSDIV